MKKRRPRLFLARCIARLGQFISSLPLMVLRPDDLLEFNRQKCADPLAVQHWGSDKVVAGGLTPLENLIVEKIDLTQGKALVLGLGGGREAIPLARMGFSVTGVDFIPELVALAQANAVKHGVHLDARVGDFVSLEMPPAEFELIWLSDRLYSSVPTHKKRRRLLHRINEALKPNGWFVCMFWWNPALDFSPKGDWLRRMVAYLSLGNIWYEPGDLLGSFFGHAFRSEAELTSEFAAGGFVLHHLHLPREAGDTFGAALLHKRL